MWYYAQCLGYTYKDGKVRRVTNSQYVISYTPINENEHQINIIIEGRLLLTVELNPKG